MSTVFGCRNGCRDGRCLWLHVDVQVYVGHRMSAINKSKLEKPQHVVEHLWPF